MYKLPAMYVGTYAERDAQLTLELWQELKKEIIHQDIEAIFKMEMELFPVSSGYEISWCACKSRTSHDRKENIS